MDLIYIQKMTFIIKAKLFIIMLIQLLDINVNIVVYN